MDWFCYQEPAHKFEASFSVEARWLRLETQWSLGFSAPA